MKTILRRIFIVILFVAGLSTTIGYALFNKKRTGLLDEDPVAYVVSSNLVSEYESNEENTNKKYLGKVLQVGGIITEVSMEKDGLNVCLKGNDLSTVLCQFDSLYPLPQNLSVGNNIEVKGVCSGLLMDVVLVDCVLIKRK